MSYKKLPPPVNVTGIQYRMTTTSSTDTSPPSRNSHVDDLSYIDGNVSDEEYEEPPDDEAAEDKEKNELHAVHRNTFNLLAFGTTFEGGPISKSALRNKRLMSKVEYDEYINVLRYWNIAEGHFDPVSAKHVTQEEFRRSHGKGWYRTSKKYKISTSRSTDGTVQEVLKKLDEKTLNWKVVLHEQNVFDALFECHRTVGHKKVAATRNEASKTYYNVTEDLCKIFVNCCPECCHEPPKLPKMIGAKNPIYSVQFRDRFQADLVDYRSNPQKDVYGIEMKWLLVLKDHFTKFTMLRPIARKEAKLVAHELSFMFGVLGYPLIFQTDNGKEFTADVVLKLVRQWNPSCKTVTGRRRTPRDQGSVERANASVKSVIAKLEQGERNKGNEEPNWVLLTPAAMAAINCFTVDGRGQQSAYSHVFGMEYSLPLLAQLGTGEKSRDVKSLDMLLNSPGFREKMVAIGEFPSEYSNKSPESMMDDESISKELFTPHELEVEWTTPPPKSPLKSPADAINVCQEIILVDQVHNSISTPATSSPPVAHSSDKNKVPKTRLPVDIALKNKNVRLREIEGKQYRIVHPHLLCDTCESLSLRRLLTVAEKSYYDLNITSKRWWCSDMVSTFGILMTHDVHRPDLVYVDSGTPTKVQFLKNTIPVDLPSGIKYILSIAHAKSHFAVLQFKMEEKVLVIYDGLGLNEETWKPHLDYVLARFNVPSNGWKALSADGKAKIAQHDGYNCGPIACMVLWNLLRPELDVLKETVESDYRMKVIRELIRLLDVYSEDLVVVQKSKKAEGKSKQKPLDARALKDPPPYAREKDLVQDSLVESRVLESPEVPEVSRLTHAQVSTETEISPRTPEVRTERPLNAAGKMDQQMGNPGLVLPTRKLRDLLKNDGLYDDGPYDGLEEDSDDDLPEIDDSSDDGKMLAKNLPEVNLPEVLPELVMREEVVPVTPSVKESAGNTTKDDIGNDVAASQEKRQKTREAADKKRRGVQDAQARKMRKRFVESARIELGEAVVLKVDERDRANHNPLGIQGVVASRAGSGRNVYVVCAAGVLSAKNKPIAYAPEEMGVLKNPTLPSKLRSIQESVRNGTFDMKLQPVTSVANAHKVLYGSDSHGRGRCKCKNGCAKHCGCRRKKIPCSSSCICNGNCENISS